MNEEPKQNAELEPCPFCGAEPLYDDTEIEGLWTVTCSNEGCVCGNMAVNPILWNRRPHAQDKAGLQAKDDRLEAWVNGLDSAYWLDLELARFETCEIGDEAGNVWKGETPMQALAAYLDAQEKENAT